MSDATTAADSTIASAAPAAPEKSAPTAAPSEPAWLPERLERAKQAAKAEILKDLGVDDPAAAKAVFAKAKELEEAQKTEIQKLTEKTTKLDAEAKKAAEYEKVISQRADYELSKLSDEQKAAVALIAGDDKAKALSAITALAPTWAKAAEPAKKEPPAAPAQTGATGAAPSGNGGTPTVNHKATWESLKKTNPVYAAQYLEAYAAAIFPPQ